VALRVLTGPVVRVGEVHAHCCLICVRESIARSDDPRVKCPRARIGPLDGPKPAKHGRSTCGSPATTPRDRSAMKLCCWRLVSIYV
jgi:hypothetical protein